MKRLLIVAVLLVLLVSELEAGGRRRGRRRKTKAQAKTSQAKKSQAKKSELAVPTTPKTAEQKFVDVCKKNSNGQLQKCTSRVIFSENATKAFELIVTQCDLSIWMKDRSSGSSNTDNDPQLSVTKAKKLVRDMCTMFEDKKADDLATDKLRSVKDGCEKWIAAVPEEEDADAADAEATT